MAILAELWRRHPIYAALGYFQLAGVPVYLILMQMDPTQVDGINVWVKPLKFGVSLGFFSLTLAFFAKWMRDGARQTILQRLVVALYVIAILFETYWLNSASYLGIRSHFNTDGGLYTILYPLSGLAAVFLVLAAFAMGVSVLRNRRNALNPAMAEAIGWGLVLTFILTPAFGFLLSSPVENFGGSKNGYGDGYFGWRMLGGDLRAVHFFATHALHVIPAAGFVVSRVFKQGAGIWINRLIVLVYAGLIVHLGIGIVTRGADLPEIFRSPF